MTRVDYDRRAKDYCESRGLALSAIAAWRDALAPYLVPAPPLPVVDLGSGTGHFAVALAEWFGVEVLGVEPSPGMREVAERQNPHPRVTYLGGRAEDIPLADHSCSAAWLSTVVHHIGDLTKCARELRRVLRAGAPVLIRSSFPGHHDEIALFRFFPSARRAAERFPTIAEVVDAFAPSGFHLERVDDIPQVSAPSLRAFCERARVQRHADTTLAGLSDDEFEAGVRRAEKEADEQPAPRPIVDKLTLLVLR